MKDFGYTKAHTVLSAPYFKAVMKSVETAIDLTESTVDHYLPATDNEPHFDAQTKEKQNVVERMGYLSDKMRKRMYKQALQQIEMIQKRSQEALTRLNKPLDLVSQNKEFFNLNRLMLGCLC